MYKNVTKAQNLSLVQEKVFKFIYTDRKREFVWKNLTVRPKKAWKVKLYKWVENIQ